MKAIISLFIIVISFILFFTSSVLAQSSKPYWQQQVNFNISVKLNDDIHSLDAFEKLEYINNSPDTLHFIWFHLWANAYKNDKTAFSEQLLKNGRTDFYFSEDSMKGYINQLEFIAGNETLLTEADPEHIDIIKVLLSKPLPPKASINITTPFHVQLPHNFSRGGHIENDYQITQWFPKPAVYDAKGWHPMPYLDQGEFYSEFGNYEVEITVPETYIVAATGQLQTTSELEFLKQFSSIQKKKFEQRKPVLKKKTVQGSTSFKKAINPKTITKNIAQQKTKTLVYTQTNCHDFAWFANKSFVVNYDTVKLSDKVVDVFSFYPAKRIRTWDKAIGYAKDGLKYYSTHLGTYPYSTASIVCGPYNVSSGGMEYPTITLITTYGDAKDLDATIVHELGHNWFYGALASNERDHAWMDEGMNTFYQLKYEKEKYKKSILSIKSENKFIQSRLPEDITDIALNTLDGLHKSQPINSKADEFTSNNYGFLVYLKTAQWMDKLEQDLGAESFETAMKKYYSTWQFKHPYPNDFKTAIEIASHKNIDSLYQQLFVTTPPLVNHKKIKPVALFSLKETDKYNYISVLPALGFNYYDKLMLGVLIHNYQLPLNKFQFIAAPMYAFGSGAFNYFGNTSYHIYKTNSQLQFGLSIAKYSFNSGTKERSGTTYAGISRFVPSIQFTKYLDGVFAKEKLELSFKTFYLNANNLDYQTIKNPGDTFDIIQNKKEQSYINQLKLVWSNNRVLYPFNYNLTIEQGEQFVRAGFTAKYFLNYKTPKQGITARFFAGKFFYLGTKTISSQIKNDPYFLNLTGPKGNEDYTYSDYFVGRSSFEGWRSQQIMERDGFFKMRTDLLGNKVGRTDNWLMALNLSGDIPKEINILNMLPVKIPLKIFVDIGTYAEAWQENSTNGRFVYCAGLQLPLLKGLVNIYAPILMSKVYRDYNASILGDNIFLKNLSFQISLEKLKLNRIIPDFPL